MMNAENFLWTERYRPKTVDDILLPERFKKTFQAFVKDGNVPNLLLAGPPGIGKTTAARAILEEIGSTYIMVNASLDGSKDTLRNEIKDFATTLSLDGGRKYVILDEADHLSHHMQPALRTFMEEYSSNCGFILTCNYKNKIIEPLHSRCSLVEFTFTKQDKAAILKDLFTRVLSVLDAEKVKYNKKVIAELVKKHFPDMRRILNELQKYAANGEIDSGILVDFDEKSIKVLMEALKTKKYDEIRAWVNENEFDDTEVYTKLYEVGAEYFTKQSLPQMILVLAEYQYKSAFAVNKDINLLAALVELAVNCEFV